MRTNQRKKVVKRAGWMAAVVSALVLAGCGPKTEESTTAAPQTFQPTGAPAVATSSPAGYQYQSKVGVPLAGRGDPGMIPTLVSSRSFSSRPDPFALLSQERIFDMSQRAERIQSEVGFSTMFEEPEVVVSIDDTPEPQPYRRLAGILVGDTVSAILIMENGDAHIVKPGTRIPNSPWRVVSIDEEKAVLRRAGTRKPTQIVVRLETPPGGVPNPAGQGGFGPPGGAQPGGGEDVGGPPGRPGRGGTRGGPGAVGGADR